MASPFGRVFTATTVANPAAQATTDYTIAVIPPGLTGNITAVTFTGDAVITGVDTNSARHDVIIKGLTGGDTRVAATKTYPNGVTTVAFDETALTVTTTAANSAVVPDDVIAFSVVKLASNVAVTTPRLFVKIVVNAAD
jgi:hypothetical protein